MRVHGWAFLSLLGILPGCGAGLPAPVLMRGSRAELAALAGTWQGTYRGVDSNRDGSILMIIKPGSDSAHGDVMMIPAVSGTAIVAEDARTRAHGLHARSPDYLRITFVHVVDGVVDGALEPYVAPDCRCVVTTEFRGTVRGNEIAGEFVTRGEGGLHQRGTWRVSRPATAPPSRTRTSGE